MPAQRPEGRGVFAENDPHSIAQRIADGEPSGLTDGLEQAIDRDFITGARVGGGATVATTPIGRAVLDKLNSRIERPDVRLKLMIADAREKLAELDDQREKLEAYREVQITAARELHDAVKEKHLKSIEHHETQIAAIRQALEQGDIDQRAKLLDIESNIDAQVFAIDTMETLHRNVIDSAPPKPKRRKKDKDSDIPY